MASWFWGKLPFSWNQRTQSKGIPLIITAMAANGVPDPAWTGLVTVTTGGTVGFQTWYRLLGIYAFPECSGPAMSQVQVMGGRSQTVYCDFSQTGVEPGTDGSFVDVSVHLVDAATGTIGGNSGACRLTPATPLPVQPKTVMILRAEGAEAGMPVYIEQVAPGQSVSYTVQVDGQARWQGMVS